MAGLASAAARVVQVWEDDGGEGDVDLGALDVAIAALRAALGTALRAALGTEGV
jgi:hypothetical protein